MVLHHNSSRRDFEDMRGALRGQAPRTEVTQLQSAVSICRLDLPTSHIVVSTLKSQPKRYKLALVPLRHDAITYHLHQQKATTAQQDGRVLGSGAAPYC